jgi:hypothetical protein
MRRAPDIRRVAAAPRPRRAVRLATVAVASLTAFAAGLGVGRAGPAGSGAVTAPTPARPGAAASARPGPGPGPRGAVDGVPVGYQRSRAGAVAAASQYGLVAAGPLLFDEARRRAAVRAMAAPEAAARLDAELARAAATIGRLTGIGPDAGAAAGAVVLPVLVGYRVDGYGPDGARVAIWSTGILGLQGRYPARSVWSTTVQTLRWVGGDWKLISSVTSEGPVPLESQQAPSPEEVLLGQATTFGRYRYAPGARP